MSNEKDKNKMNGRMNFYCTLEEMQWIDSYRFRNHIPTKTEALHNIMILGMEQMKLLEQQKLVVPSMEKKVLEDENK